MSEIGIHRIHRIFIKSNCEPPQTKLSVNLSHLQTQYLRNFCCAIKTEQNVRDDV